MGTFMNGLHKSCRVLILYSPLSGFKGHDVLGEDTPSSRTLSCSTGSATEIETRMMRRQIEFADRTITGSIEGGAYLLVANGCQTEKRRLSLVMVGVVFRISRSNSP